MSKANKLGAIITMALALSDNAEKSLKDDLRSVYSYKYQSSPAEIRKEIQRGSLTNRQRSLVVRRVEPREGPKVGRNEPCTCGSGQKYKKCCLNKK